MTLSSISNAGLAKSHISHQKTETDTKITGKSKSSPTSENNLSGNKFDDNVTLGQSEKTSASSKVIDQKAADTILSQTMKSILNQSKTAISAQANTTPQAAQEILIKN